MTRVTKEYDERLKELLDTAQRLFFQKGYEKTSVNHIIDAVGVAKGTFYHYFKSKEDLLDQLVTRFTAGSLEEAKKVMKRKGLNAVERMNRFFIKIKDKKVENKELMKMLMKVMYTDENLIFRHKVFKKSIALMTPYFAEIVKQGIDEGLFQPQDHEETAELIFTMALNLNETVVRLLLDAEAHPENIDKIDRKIKAYYRGMERMLGAAEGSLSFYRREDIEVFKIGKTTEG
jgi:AcrR family transcriptional regulator